jgi:hypothetical protein
MQTREEFHKLIDTIRDDESLKSYLSLIQKLQHRQSGTLWNQLSDDQKQELLLAYDESFDPNNTLSHEQVKQQHAKWLNQ